MITRCYIRVVLHPLSGEAVKDAVNEYRRRVECLEDTLTVSGIPVPVPVGEAGGAGGPRAVAVAPAGAAEAAKGGRNAISVTPGLQAVDAMGLMAPPKRLGQGGPRAVRHCRAVVCLMGWGVAWWVSCVPERVGPWASRWAVCG